MVKFNQKLRLLAGVASIACVVTTAHAQTEVLPQAGAGAETSPSNAIAEIVVTARRRAENMQSVPVAITAITSEALREKAIATPYDLTNSTPGIAATAGSATRNDVQYFIRGQGTTYGSTPSVVTYFAEVPQLTFAATGGSNITFFDLESAQVLKGPQGTLFGRSTTAGAVLLTPKKPTGEFDGFLEVGIGNYNMREVTGAIDIPIIGDSLAVRVAGNYSAHDGYSRSLTNGQDLDDRNRFSYRVTVLARPTDWLTNTTIFSDTDIDENGTALTLTGYEPEGLARAVVDSRLPAGFAVTGSLLDTRAGGIYDPTGFVVPASSGGVTDITQAGGYGYIAVQGLCAAITAPMSPENAACVNQRLGLINQTAAAFAAEQARIDAGGDPRAMVTGFDQFTRMRVQQVINTTEINFGEVGFLGDTTFKNIFSTTRRVNAAAVREIQDAIGTGIAFNGVNLVHNNCSATACTGNITVIEDGSGRDDWFDEWSEEAQLSGRINGAHDWIIGYFTERSNQNFYMNVPSVFQVLNGAFSVPAGLPSVSSGYADPYKASQTGYFGQATIDFSEFGINGLRFTAGYRHSIVKQDTTSIGAFLLPSVGLVPNPTDVTIASLKQKADSYTFSLDYKVQPDVLVYATTRKGFKQGGINAQAVPFSDPSSPNFSTSARAYFAPETVTDYEVGLKTDYVIGNIGMRTNIAVFQADYSDLHRNSTFFNGSTSSTQIVNAAKMRTRGIELEQVFRFSPAFTVNVNYAYLDAKFREFPGGIIRPGDGMVIDNINTPVTGAPKHKLDVSARYSYDAGETGQFVMSGNVGYQSRTNQADAALSTLNGSNQAPYALANLRLDWNNVMGNPIDVGLFGKNVLNKLYRLSTSNLIDSQLATETAIYGDPATYGVQVRVRFGRSGER
ncbi:MAG: TonB-dependent receptor [Alphaproteobacteria bacterium]|nr:TonB-dependent receptor [Alphaproteobacteria bacterium]